MGAKIKLGKAHDDTVQITDLETPSRHSNLVVKGGDLYDRAVGYNRIKDTTQVASRPAEAADQTSQRASTPTVDNAVGLWARGSFFLLAFLIVGTIIGTLAFKLSWYLVPLAVVGTILAIYLLAIILEPRGALTEKGLLSVLSSYVKLAFVDRSNRQGKENKPKALPDRAK